MEDERCVIGFKHPTVSEFVAEAALTFSGPPRRPWLDNIVDDQGRPAFEIVQSI